MIRKYKALVLTPIIAPYVDTVYFRSVREVLKKKYGDLAGHIDRAFDRWIIDNELRPVIHGSTIYGAIKRALNEIGKPLTGVSVHCMYFDEDNVAIFKKSIVNNKGKQTMIVTEIIPSNVEGIVLGNLEKLKKQGLKELTIQIGGKRKHGYGLVKLILD